ncbi:MAG: hypothetical protein KDD25_07410 [Bdellovibrionales bacterium]|nr:hypothetical protein [Bdellovibrionales bacterium]
MSVLRFAVFMILLFFCVEGKAQSLSLNTGNEGVRFSASAGYSMVEIVNSDHTKAYYGGLSAMGGFDVPVIDDKWFRAGLGANIRYIDMSNNADSDEQRETGNHLGYGPSVNFRFFKFLVGAEYYWVNAKHYWVGELNDFREFDMNVFSYYGGMDFNLFKGISISVLYTKGTGVISKKDLELPNDATYNENIIWINFNFFTGSSLGELVEPVFK